MTWPSFVQPLTITCASASLRTIVWRSSSIPEGKGLSRLSEYVPPPMRRVSPAERHDAPTVIVRLASAGADDCAAAQELASLPSLFTWYVAPSVNAGKLVSRKYGSQEASP